MGKKKQEHKKSRLSQITEIVAFHNIVFEEVRKRYPDITKGQIELLQCCETIFKDHGYFTIFLLSRYTSRHVKSLRNDQVLFNKLGYWEGVNEKSFYQIRRFQLSFEARKLLMYYNRIMINTVRERVVNYSPSTSPFAFSLLASLSSGVRNEERIKAIQAKKLKWRMNKEKKANEAKNNKPGNQ